MEHSDLFTEISEYMVAKGLSPFNTSVMELLEVLASEED
jgi:hypothetical protein